MDLLILQIMSHRSFVPTCRKTLYQFYFTASVKWELCYFPFRGVLCARLKTRRKTRSQTLFFVIRNDKTRWYSRLRWLFPINHGQSKNNNVLIATNSKLLWSDCERFFWSPSSPLSLSLSSDIHKILTRTFTKFL